MNHYQTQTSSKKLSSQVKRNLNGLATSLKELPKQLKPKSLLEIINTYDAKTIAYTLSPLEQLKRLALQGICKTNPNLAGELSYKHFKHARKRINYSQKELPQNAKPFSLDYKKGQLKGYSWGNSSKRIYLVHGWESTLSLMTNFVNPLVEMGYQVIAFDAPGHGKSSTQDTGLCDFMQALTSVIELFGNPHAIIAHSCGAAATTLMLEKNPSIKPEKVILLAPMPSQQIKLDIYSDIAKLPSHIKHKLKNKLEQNTGYSLDELKLSTAAQSISTNALIIHDQNDSLIPHKESFEIAKNWKNSSFVTTQGLGHIKLLFCPKIISQSCNFIGNNQ